MARVQFKPRVRTDLIVVHCAATKPGMDIGLREIRMWHRQRGFLDVGYHLIIRRDGTVEHGRDIGVIGAHVKGHNSTSVGICMVGGVDDAMEPQNNFTDAQFATLREQLRDLERTYPEARVVGHNELDDGKACPSFNVQEWLAANPL
ncbi:N-acetylmuramoyl-L-alanine amidase [Pseudomonas sp. B14(2017)]|uniref:peptidoglycan recognition protein family protein n=1 Tax=Pseudomonas sp. B14(2017) TaxID=1981745 RepID=UPI000A1FB416|nr:N-acetylmuramoyl-L-alanine amidase [Pseudomonas sp. B14(2017)]